MKKTVLLSLSLSFSATALVAQGSASTSSASSGDAVVPITLGQSAVVAALKTS